MSVICEFLVPKSSRCVSRPWKLGRVGWVFAFIAGRARHGTLALTSMGPGRGILALMAGTRRG